MVQLFCKSIIKWMERGWIMYFVQRRSPRLLSYFKEHRKQTREHLFDRWRIDIIFATKVIQFVTTMGKNPGLKFIRK